MKSDGGLVWSSKHGRMCPGCGRPAADCACRGDEVAPVGEGDVRIAKETKGRRGKTVTVVTGVPLDAAKLTKLGKRLKQLCGSGGTVREGTIEIQGDHRAAIAAELTRLGYAVRG